MVKKAIVQQVLPVAHVFKGKRVIKQLTLLKFTGEQILISKIKFENLNIF